MFRLPLNSLPSPLIRFELLLLVCLCNFKSPLSLQVFINNHTLHINLERQWLSRTPQSVFVPGAWHTPDTFDGIRALLSKRGHDSEAIVLPSVSAAEPTKSGLHADIAHTNGVLRALADQGRQIIVVMHSYGGMVGAGAAEGLVYAQRSKAGQLGGVIMMVWLAAFVTPRGKSVIDMLGGNWLPWMLLSVCISRRSCLSFFPSL
jgi:hypothetical protein